MVDKVQAGSDTVQTRSGTVQTARHGSGMVQSSECVSDVKGVKRQEALQRVTAPTTRDRRRQRRQASRGSPESHQVPRLPRETAAASKASSVKRLSPQSHQVPRLPRETAAASTASSVKRPSRESPSAAPATQDGRGVNGVKRQEALQGVVKTSGSKAILQHATIFGGLNLHLPAILFSPGHQGLD